MMQNLPPYKPRLSPSHHQSLGNLSDGNISDTISESSDNATLLSLSREDLLALGAGHIREDVRVNRKKMEALILRERDNPPGDKHYMDLLMERTNTYVQWPSRMKIGAKTKKDLYIRVYGHNQEDVNEAKNQILTDLGPHRDLRITLKMEISYTDHSHLIGCRGQTIRKVMDDTGCHIHFPDSNRMSKEHKSNQVTIAGSSVASVEMARARVRELSPLIFQFTLPAMHSPYELSANPDAHHVFLENIQTTYGVQVTIHPPNKLQQTTVSVKGCEVDSAGVKEAVGKIMGYFSGNTTNTLQVESTMEISPAQHPFVRAVNDSNVHAVMMNTGAKIIFPDLTDGNIQQIKRSRIFTSGEINCVYNARQQLIGCLPLRMIFDLADDFHLDWEIIRQMGSELNVNVKMINRNRTGGGDRNGGNGNSLAHLPPPVPGRSRTIQLVAHERNTSNMFEVRRRILGGLEKSFHANIPQSYLLRPTFHGSEVKGHAFSFVNRMGTPINGLPPLLLPTSPNMMSPILSPSFWPPTPFGSPFCSPQFMMNNPSNPMGVGYGGQHVHHMNGMGHGREGLGKLTLNLQPGMSYGYNPGMSSPSPMNPNPPEISISSLKQSLQLPILNPHNLNLMNAQGGGNDSALNTPLSVGGTSTFSDLSPMFHPAIGMVNSLVNDFGHMEFNRKAPGCERSGASSTSTVVTPADMAEDEGNGEANDEIGDSGVDVAALKEVEEIGPEQNPNEGMTSGTAERAKTPVKDGRKYMAIKAMYQTRIDETCSPRVPNAEWSGLGFSKTYQNLFPEGKKTTTALGGTRNGHGLDNGNGNLTSTNNKNNDKDNGINGDTGDAWTTSDTAGSSSGVGDSSGRGGTTSAFGSSDGCNSSAQTSTETDKPGVKPPHILAHQQSNLLDFSTLRRLTDGPPKDLPTLFIQNGLEKYIDTFLTEEIDLDIFSTLNEVDLRSLGVTAYPARKRMLVLITQLACPHQTHDPLHY